MIQDEADEMLSRGFKDQIYDVYRYLPPELQVTIETYSLGLWAQMIVFPFFFVFSFVSCQKIAFFSPIALSDLPPSSVYHITMTYDMHVSSFL
jgi:hypothetical protein